MFDHPDFDDHEQVMFARDAAAGLRAIIALHSTALGPAFGGCRMRPYRERGRGADRRAAARARHDLQGRDLRPALWRRQVGDHRRSRARQDAGPAAGDGPRGRARWAAATSWPTTSAPRSRTSQLMRAVTSHTAAATAAAREPLAVTAYGVLDGDPGGGPPSRRAGTGSPACGSRSRGSATSGGRSPAICTRRAPS